MAERALDHWPEFKRKLLERLQAGERAYGDASAQRPPSELAHEIEQELLDLTGWGFLLWLRLRRLLKKLPRPDAPLHDMDLKKLLAELGDAAQCNVSVRACMSRARLAPASRDALLLTLVRELVSENARWVDAYKRQLLFECPPRLMVDHQDPWRAELARLWERFMARFADHRTIKLSTATYNAPTPDVVTPREVARFLAKNGLPFAKVTFEGCHIVVHPPDGEQRSSFLGMLGLSDRRERPDG